MRYPTIPPMPLAIQKKLARLTKTYRAKKTCPICDARTPRGLKVDVTYDWLTAEGLRITPFDDVWMFGAAHGGCSFLLRALEYRAEIKAIERGRR